MEAAPEAAAKAKAGGEAAGEAGEEVGEAAGKAVALMPSYLQEYLNNPKFAECTPVGLPVLVQSTVLDIEPSSSSPSRTYDKGRMLEELRELEKEVVQFQIDYKRQAWEVAGAQADELEKVLSTLQHRGLELTKWLRGFVKYMVARRDIEQEIVDVSGKRTHTEAMDWFDLMTNYLNTAPTTCSCASSAAACCTTSSRPTARWCSTSPPRCRPPPPHSRRRPPRSLRSSMSCHAWSCCPCRRSRRWRRGTGCWPRCTASSTARAAPTTRPARVRLPSPTV